MRLSNVREAACIRASTLLNQANPKKGFKSIQPELQNVRNINNHLDVRNFRNRIRQTYLQVLV